MHFRIATDNTKLAITQANMVAEKLENIGHTFELIEVPTGRASKLASYFYGDEKVVIKKLQDALSKSRADIAVHAMKDIIYNHSIVSDFTFPAVLKREYHREVVISRENGNFLKLKDGSKIGVSSARKAAQIKRAFPGLHIEYIYGSFESKLERLEKKQVDAIVVSQLDIKLLKIDDRVDVVLESDVLMPAFGQGMIGIECKIGNKDIIDEIQKINDVETHECFKVEQSILQELNCEGQAPVAGYCEYSLGGSLRVVALVSSKDGQNVLRTRLKEKDIAPEIFGQKVAQDLIEKGAVELMNQTK
ncbi:MAG: hydroxymethylbilane synthase [Proteobacteria bacterium]|nr:hydroxymethylbilane synthase [Pseudomonadota bacterium]